VVYCVTPVGNRWQSLSQAVVWATASERPERRGVTQNRCSEGRTGEYDSVSRLTGENASGETHQLTSSPFCSAVVVVWSVDSTVGEPGDKRASR